MRVCVLLLFRYDNGSLDVYKTATDAFKHSYGHGQRYNS